MSVLQPIGQVRLTNVAYVRLTKNGKRFEIACYRNKVLNWRNKIEQDINEVLQVASVFLNVSKGTHASAKDLQQAFGTSDPVKVCEEILEKGDLQVSEKERETMLDSMFRDVASLVCEMTINPDNGRQYSLSMIQNAMKQIHYSVNLRSAKKQALDVIRKLRPVMSIVRAGMLIKLVCRQQDVEAIGTMLEAESRYLTLVKRYIETVAGTAVAAGSESTGVDNASDAWFEVRIDPEAYRRLEDAVRIISEGFGRVEILQLRVTSAGGAEPPTLPNEADVVAPLSRLSVISPDESSKSCVRELPAAEEVDTSDDDSMLKPFAKGSNTRDKKKEKKKKGRENRKTNEELIIASAATHDIDAVVTSAVAPAADAPPEPPVAAGPEGKKCNTCGGSFPSDGEYRLHFRSEWHRYNLKRKMKSLPTVTETDFNSLSAAEIAKATDT